MEKGNPFTLLMGMKIGATTMKSSMKITQKIKNGTALLPSDSTSGNLSKETQNTNSKGHKHPNVHCRVIYNHQMSLTG